MFLPRALSTLTDAQNALDRLTDVFEAETMEVQNNVKPDLDVALRVKNATFRWADATFSMNLSMDIPRGQLTAIVGPVGSGKSSLLQGVSLPVAELIAYWRNEFDWVGRIWR